MRGPPIGTVILVHYSNGREALLTVEQNGGPPDSIGDYPDVCRQLVGAGKSVSRLTSYYAIISVPKKAAHRP